MVPSIVPLTRPGGMFGRASTTIFPRSAPNVGIMSLASNESGVYLLSSGILQKWTISADGHKFIQELDLEDSLSRSFADIELIDLAAFGCVVSTR